MQKTISYPCPICHTVMFIVGKTEKGEKIGSCGHSFKFKKTRSQKDFDRKYIKTENGWELRDETTK